MNYTTPLIACLLSLAALAPGAEEPTATLWGVRVVAPGVTFDSKQLRAFNWMQGTTLSFAISGGDKSIIAVDAEGSTITSAADSTGKDIAAQTKDSNGWTQSAQVGSFSDFAPDGSIAVVEVQLPGFPAPGSQHINLEAQITITTASGTSEVISAAQPILPKTTFIIRDMSLPISKVGKPEWGDAAQEISITYDNLDPSIIAGLSLVTADGKEHPLTQSSYWSSGSNGKMKVEVSYTSPVNVKKGKLKAKLYTGLEKITVALPKKVGLGVGK